MNKALIGEEVALEAPADGGLVPLIVDTVEAFLQAAGGEPRDLGRLDSELRTAFEQLASNGSGARVRARLVLVAAGIEVNLQHGSDAETLPTIVCPA